MSQTSYECSSPTKKPPAWTKSRRLSLNSDTQSSHACRSELALLGMADAVVTTYSLFRTNPRPHEASD